MSLKVQCLQIKKPAFPFVATANHHVLHIFPSHNNLLHALDIWNLNNFVIFYDEKKSNNLIKKTSLLYNLKSFQR